MGDKIRSNQSILLSTGEASGDAVGAALFTELRTLGYSGEGYAIGASKLARAGVELLADSSHWGAIGIYQSLKVAPRVWRDLRPVQAFIHRVHPQLLIAIDFGFVNVRLCRIAKSAGCKTLYFMPPGSWRRERQGANLPFVSDIVATPFEWSANILRKMGANVEWVGHPILQMTAQYTKGDRAGIAVLPGSRRHEIKHNVPAIAKAVEIIGDRCYPVRIVAAPTADPSDIERLWKSASAINVEISTDPAPATLNCSVAAVVCSGTATLESAVCDCPMVVVYRGDKMMELEYRLRRPKFQFFAMPSILLERRVVPELLQWDATPERIAQELSSLLEDGDERMNQLRDFEEIRRVLGPADALTRTARLAMDLMEQPE